ncbi:hypothetical protein MLD38_010855 [Melastoma candidum]|uniref:Uncharacterized protein n=1 Tax=Melastoma candidum TaxID=119954 RepID=A0ACB9R9I8_9MYRT|nr:hypothetical protein MLD38_010855 [Melastoma candidum]
MPPRRKQNPSAASSSKKSVAKQTQNPNPPKYGIQHFFDRHTQTNPSPSSSSSSSFSTAAAVAVEESKDGSVSVEGPAVLDHEGGYIPSEVSPEVGKSMTVKRFKFSPGMLIKQSQDDGGDEITWKISPVDERLRAVSKNMPDVMKALAESSKLSSFHIRQCSVIKSSEGDGVKVETLVSPPPPPMGNASERSVLTNLGAAKRVCPDNCEDHGDKVMEVISSCLSSLQSPFRTPPSLPYCEDKASRCNGALSQLGLRQNKKALIELLHQVEDAISVDESPEGKTEICSSEVRSGNQAEAPLQDKFNAQVEVSSFHHRAPLDKFLVLEVADKCPSVDSSNRPYKVLRLLNEQSGEERSVSLWDEWVYSVVSPGDTVHVIGQFDGSGRCDISSKDNFIVIHPDLLLSGTRVAASFTCPRRTVLDERLKSSDNSKAALIGTLLHQIFQAGLLKEEPNMEYLVEYADLVILKSIDNLFACGVTEKDMSNTLSEAIPNLLKWIILFKNMKWLESPAVDFGCGVGFKKVKISEVIDIEEMSWAPRYGLKGMIDASVRFTIESDTSESSMEHSAQVILYTLLMSERYQRPIDSGLLYYLKSNHTQGIVVQRSDIVGLIIRRNELAINIINALTTQQLPPMLGSPSTCKSCRHIDVCNIYHKAHGGTKENSGLGDLFDGCTNHLTTSHFAFLRHWNRLIDLEAKEAEQRKKELWNSQSSRHGQLPSLSFLVLDTFQGLPNGSSRDNRFTYRFVHCNLSTDQAQKSYSGENSPENEMSCKLRKGDLVVLSSESCHQTIASGILTDINTNHVSVSFSKRLRIPGSSSSSEAKDVAREVWHLHKDEVTTSFFIMRFNLIQLFLQDARSSHLRKMVIDLEAPRFDSGCIFSQDPTISYVWSEEKLNDDQRRAIVKILTARDYALILGMPGTGKTSTMVHAVKALLMRGASLLLTSYTNSAVDNLLIKLKNQGIDFIRIGRPEVVHEDIRDHCFPEHGMSTVEGIRERLDQVKVVAATCLGITSPLLSSKRFDVCIMDEAGQITLPVSLGPLMFASKFVLVGDHYQLPPLVQSTEAQEAGLGTSLFCRLSEAHPQAISALESQYRMCEGIMQLSNTLIYGNKLRCGSEHVANQQLLMSSSNLSSWWLKEVLDPGRSAVFLNTDTIPAYEGKEKKSLNNPMEAHIIAKIVDELVKGGIMEEEIGVITPYNSQANLIQSIVSKSSVEIHTIDKYQGRDKDCILVSFVRSTENASQCNSSLLSNWQRINVALTRAKKKLVMVGSRGTLSTFPMLRLLVDGVDKDQSGVLNLTREDYNQTTVLKRCSQSTRG